MGLIVVVGLPVVSGFGVAVGSSVVAGLFVAAGFCDEIGFCVAGRMLAAFGVSVTYDAVSSFTMTIQVYFFFPAFACTLAFPDFTAAIMTLLFFLFLRRIQFFPETIFHLVFFLLFFKVMILLVPTVRVIFLLLNFTALAAWMCCTGIPVSNIAAASIHARYFLQIFFFICLFLLEINMIISRTNDPY